MSNRCINVNHSDVQDLAEKLGLHPSIVAARIAVWQDTNNTDKWPTINDIKVKDNQVNYRFKSIDILLSDKAKQIFTKGEKAKWSLDKILTELQIPKDQKKLLLDLGINNREDLALELASKYSYTVEINTAKKQSDKDNTTDGFVLDNKYYRRGYGSSGNQIFEVASIIDNANFQPWEPETFDEPIEISKEAYLKAREKSGDNTQHYSTLTVPGGTNYTENRIITPQIIPSIKEHAQFAENEDIGWFRSDEVGFQGIRGLSKERALQGDIYELPEKNRKYIKNVGDTDKGEWGVFTMNGNYMYNITDNDFKVNVVKWMDELKYSTKTRRILELQSDLFQKGRDKKDLITNKGEIGDNLLLDKSKFEIVDLKNFTIKKSNKGFGTKQFGYSEIFEDENYYYTKIDNNEYGRIRKEELEEKLSKENQFLQLLNKDNNWITFFIKSIIQDSAKKEYEKVLFPKGETAAKIEGHETVANEIKRLDNLIELAKSDEDNFKNSIGEFVSVAYQIKEKTKEDFINALNKKKQEFKSQGIEKLKPIEAFYEIKVGNILEKQYGKDNIKTITDEYGNQWRELELTEQMAEETIMMSPKPTLKEILHGSAFDIDIGDEDSGYVPEYGSNDLDLIFGKKEFDAKGLIDHKAEMRYRYHKALTLIKKAKQRSTDAKEIAKLNIAELKIKDQLYGNEAKGIMGIDNEIKELAKARTVSMVTDFARKELNRMNDILATASVPAEYEEALRIAHFYKAVGDITNVDRHPLFTPKELQDIAQGKNTEAAELIKGWRTEAESAINNITTKFMPVILNEINRMGTVIKATDGKGITYEDLSNPEGLKDVWFFTRMMLSPQSTNNGLIPQIVQAYLRQMFESHHSLSRDQEDRIVELLPELEKELKKLGHSLESYGAKGVSYRLFVQNAEDGKSKTNKLIGRYSVFYENAYDESLRVLKDGLRTSGKAADAMLRWRVNHLNWLYDNHDILDYSRIQELRDYIENDDVLSERLGKPTGTVLTHNDLGITEKHFNELINEQKKKLESYKQQYIAKLTTVLEEEGVQSYDKLSDTGKFAVNTWNRVHSPLVGLNNFVSDFDGKVVPEFHNNVLIPRHTSRKGKATKFYDSNFQTIESNDTLYQFQTLAAEIFQYMSDSLPYGVYDTFINSSIPTLKKNFIETLFDGDKNLSFLDRMGEGLKYPIQHLSDMMGIGDVKSHRGTINIQTGLPNYDVNDRWIKESYGEIDKVFSAEIEKLEFFYQEEGISKSGKIGNKSVLTDNLVKGKLLQYLTGLIGCKNDITELKKSIGLDPSNRIIPVGRILYIYSSNIVYETMTANLPKILIDHSRMTALYNARTEVAPFANFLTDIYIKIPNASKGGVGQRTQGVESYVNWSTSNVFGYNENKDGGIVEDKKWKRYTTREKKLIKDYQKMLDTLNEQASKAVTEQQKIDIEARKANIQTKVDSLGNHFSWTRFLRAILAFQRMKGLGWSVSGGFNNFADAALNKEIAAQGGFFDYKNHIQAHNLSKLPSNRKKIKALMDRYSILQDATRDLEKADLKTDLSKFKLLKPYTISRSVEYVIQSPIMITYLLENKIKSKKGKESTVWDALDADGNLKPEFTTDENKANWEKGNGKQYFTFKSNTVAFIKMIFGDYDQFGGGEYKQYLSGQLLMMFRSYLPEAINRYWGVEKSNIELGTMKQKGILRSLTSISGAMKGGTALALTMGLPGLALGSIAGFGLAMTNHITAGNINHLQELSLHMKVLLHKLYGIPYNRFIASWFDEDKVKRIDLTTDINKYLEAGFNEIDAKNLSQVMAATAIELQIMMLGMLVKAVLWEPDDKKESLKKKAYNMLINRISTISSGMAAMSNPYVNYKEVVMTGAAGRMVNDFHQLVLDMGNYGAGNDTYITGPFAGESKIARHVSRMILPTIVKSPFTLGLEGQMSKDFSDDSTLGNDIIEALKTPEKDKIKAKKRRAGAIERAELRELYPDKSADEIYRMWKKQHK